MKTEGWENKVKKKVKQKYAHMTLVNVGKSKPSLTKGANVNKNKALKTKIIFLLPNTCSKHIFIR